NANEQALLVPFKINLPENNPMPLFEYTSFITSIDGQYLSSGVLNFLQEYSESYHIKAIKRSLISMFLRKSNRLNTLSLSNNNLDNLGGNALACALCKNNTLTTLILSSNKLGSKVGKALADTLCKNNALAFLDLSNNSLGSYGGKAIADALFKNNNLIYL